MLLNEFLKEHRKFEELQATIAQQQKGMEVLTAQLENQAALIQKGERAARDEKASGQSSREQTLAVVHHNYGIIVCSLYEKDLSPFDVHLFCDDLCLPKTGFGS